MIRKIYFLFFISFNHILLAAFYLEPHAGIVSGDFEQGFSNINGTYVPTRTKYTDNSSTVRGDIGGYGAGLKLGYNFSILFFGLDISMAKENFSYITLSASSYSSSTQSFTNKVSINNVDAFNLHSSLFFGIDIPYVPRIWVGYNFVDYLKLDFKPTVDEFMGGGPRFGVGFGSTFRLNVEYLMQTYGSRDGLDLPGNVSEDGLTYKEGQLKNTSYYLSLGMPFQFGNLVRDTFPEHCSICAQL